MPGSCRCQVWPSPSRDLQDSLCLLQVFYRPDACAALHDSPPQAGRGQSGVGTLAEFRLVTSAWGGAVACRSVSCRSSTAPGHGGQIKVQYKMPFFRSLRPWKACWSNGRAEACLACCILPWPVLCRCKWEAHIRWGLSSAAAPGLRCCSGLLAESPLSPVVSRQWRCSARRVSTFGAMIRWAIPKPPKVGRIMAQHL